MSSLSATIFRVTTKTFETEIIIYKIIKNKKNGVGWVGSSVSGRKERTKNRKTEKIGKTLKDNSN